MLIETSPAWPVAERKETYNAFVRMVIGSISSPQDMLVKNDLGILLEKYKGASCVACFPRSSTTDGSAVPIQPVGLLALISTVALLLIRTAAARCHIGYSTTESRRIKPPKRRALTLTEAVRCDLPIHSRLALIQRSRSRPSDRTQVQAASMSEKPADKLQVTGYRLQVHRKQAVTCNL
jgi:hypothetical protein